MTISGWPIIEADITIKFGAVHSLPAIGVAELHWHLWEVTAGWKHEINPHNGCTKPMQSMRDDLAAIIRRLEDKNLTTVFAPYPPTAETLACYVMAKLPPYWNHVEVRAYDGYRVRVEGNSMRRLWTEIYEKLP